MLWYTQIINEIHSFELVAPTAGHEVFLFISLFLIAFSKSCGFPHVCYYGQENQCNSKLYNLYF